MLENFGLLYTEMERPLDAISYLEESLHYLELSGEISEKGSILTNLGVAHRQNNDLQSAEDCSKQAEMLFERFHNQLGLSRVKGNLGIIEMKRSNWMAAINYFKRSLAGYRKLNNHEGKISVLPHLIECELALENRQRALIWIDELDSLLSQHESETQFFPLMTQIRNYRDKIKG